MLTHSEAFKSIMGAILKVQAAAGGVVRDATNPHFKSRYASLENVVDALRGPCQAAGLVILQSPSTEGNIVSVQTMIVHAESGEWIASTLSMPASKPDAQGIGSAITYNCRYSLMALFNLPPIDDDGEGAVARKGNGKPAADDGPIGPIDAGQIASLRAIIAEVGADETLFCRYMKIDSLDVLPASDYGRAVDALGAKRGKK